MAGREGKVNRHARGGGEAKPNIELGNRLKQRRIDAGLTQQELADAVGATREYLAHIESGRVKGVVYPELLNKLQSVLGFVGWEMLEAMGYSTGAMPLGGDGIDSALLARLAGMTPEQQRTVLAMIMINDRLNNSDAADNEALEVAG
ncbi:MAG TPA: helix-turn-helix transcriptional regulator [Tepidiformaceae bacterium]|nr:helix-turn-helix transcriptional regulator [Tepidiformaceae bacterium]